MKELKFDKIYKTRNDTLVKVRYIHRNMDKSVGYYTMVGVGRNSIYYTLSSRGTYYIDLNIKHRLDIVEEEQCELPKKKTGISLKRNFSLEEIMDFE